LVLRNQTKKALLHRFKQLSPCKILPNGYLTKPAHNLLPGLRLEQFESELSSGSGNELAGKFRAVHSSSALAANTFAPFKVNPAELDLIGIHGFRSINFEQKLPTGLGGTPPNIDLLAENESNMVAVESKFLEYFGPKKPSFKSSYTKNAFPKAEEKWLDLIERLRDGTPKYLDVAQLIKHYLGLCNTIDCSKRQVTLLYLFWEPENRDEFELFQTHRNELDEFSEDVNGTSIRFVYKSYPELWTEWERKGIYKEHLGNLRDRYGIDMLLH
ncbi:MAG: PGN_0703 family putative restriction endonuclease, partial [Candidatus Kariarchaeaceae archaeon]